MSAEENKALVRRFRVPRAARAMEIDKGNLAVVDELVAEDYIQ